MNLMKDAHIIMADGKEIGKLTRFVLDPRTRQVVNIVLEHGLLNRQEFVLPIQYIDRVEGDHIYLKSSFYNMDELAPFKEDFYVITNEHVMSDSAFIAGSPSLRMYYYYPPVIYNSQGGGYQGVGEYNLDEEVSYGPSSLNPLPVTGADEQAVRKEEDENIPGDTVALKEGAKVYSSDHQHVGNVDKLFMEPKDNQTTHLLITKGMLFKESKLIPADWVDEIMEDEVYLTMDSKFLSTLPDYKNKE